MGAKENYLVYVVDNDLGYTEQLKDFLQGSAPAFMRVCSFVTHDECLKYRSYKPDLIFFEHAVSSGNLSALKEIKRSYDNTPVVILTENNDLDTVATCMRNGAYSYIVKNSEAFTHIGKLVKNTVERVRERKRMISKKRRHAVMSAALILILAVALLINIT